jgi:thiamine transport system substrate-binding protein
MSRPTAFVLPLLALVLLGAACDDDDDDDDDATTLTLVTYDSFPTDGTPVNEALAEFTADTGIEVTVVTAGDAGTMLTKAALTAGNPEGDVMFGVDNTLLSRALEDDVFTAHEADGLDAIAPAYTDLVPGGELTPIDHGEVCINYDVAAFEQLGLQPPATLDDLLAPEYADLLVVQDPAASSPGLAFLLATVARYGDPGWQRFWTDLRSNGVEVVDSWDTAYYERFSGSAGSSGNRPLVVSYASSPPAEVLFADPPVDTAPTGVMTDSCFQQVEFAGVLRGTEHADEAGELVDFLIGERFQAALPLSLFVYPVRADVDLPAEFTEFSAVPGEVLSLDAAEIAANRQRWQDEWNDIVLG